MYVFNPLNKVIKFHSDFSIAKHVERKSWVIIRRCNYQTTLSISIRKRFNK